MVRGGIENEATAIPARLSWCIRTAAGGYDNCIPGECIDNTQNAQTRHPHAILSKRFRLRPLPNPFLTLIRGLGGFGFDFPLGIGSNTSR